MKACPGGVAGLSIALDNCAYYRAMSSPYLHNAIKLEIHYEEKYHVLIVF